MKENGYMMSNKQVLNFVQDWLINRRIKTFFKNKEKGKDKYIKIKEDDLYKLCYKLVELINENV